MISSRKAFITISLLGMGILVGCGGSSDNLFTRVWGQGDPGLVDGDAETARFANPANVEVAGDGTVFVADYDNNAIRLITPSGQVNTLVRQNNFQQPFGLAISGSTLYVETDVDDSGNKNANSGTIWSVGAANGVVAVVARDIGKPRGLVVLLNGKIAMSDFVHDTISILDPSTGSVTPLAGATDTPGFVNSATGSDARFNRPYGLALDPSDGSILVADQGNNVIRRVTLEGVVTTYAGTGDAGADNGPIGSATFNGPQDITTSNNRIFVDDHDNHLIRQISSGTVSTFAGDGVAGFIDAPGTLAEFFGQEGIALNPDGSILWIADGTNGDEPPGPFNRVRRLQTN